jgi:ribose 1,5-bisphosphokinase PhnN
LLRWCKKITLDMDVLIGIVGPCGAGKTTLAVQLRAQGYRVRHIAQEHSYVPAMWQKLTNPDILIYLEVSYENTLLRRKLNWSREEFEEQLRRLAHAHQHAHLVIDTNPLDAAGVLQQVEKYLASF